MEQLPRVLDRPKAITALLTMAAQTLRAQDPYRLQAPACRLRHPTGTAQQATHVCPSRM
ncbi:hypothetical protein GCM10010302_42110 [Streptomyces polychromogenes]|uniref:Uncharacterized protein n=1 Tax=Streptomyces polychromogenes TaxID=67342 RepID=A0ABN0VGK5_9ACTN